MLIQSTNQQANTIIQEITQGKNLVQSALYFAGERIQTASQNSVLPDAVKTALEIAANSAMQTGAEEWAGGLQDKYWKEVKQNPGQGGSGQNAADNHAARKLREYLNGNPKIPQLVKEKIEAILKQAPTKAKGGGHNPKQGGGVRGGGRPGGGKGKSRGSKNREFEFLFEAPLLPLTPYVSTYISPELQGSSYYTGISSEQQSQWLFEAPYISPDADWFEGSKNISNLLLVNAVKDNTGLLDYPGIYTITWKDETGKTHSTSGRAGVDLKNGKRSTNATVKSRLIAHLRNFQRSGNNTPLNSFRVHVQLLTDVKKTIDGKAMPSKEQRTLVAQAERKKIKEQKTKARQGKVIVHDKQNPSGKIKEAEEAYQDLLTANPWI